jgi:hypothetical protein
VCVCEYCDDDVSHDDVYYYEYNVQFLDEYDVCARKSVCASCASSEERRSTLGV